MFADYIFEKITELNTVNFVELLSYMAAKDLNIRDGLKHYI